MQERTISLGELKSTSVKNLEAMREGDKMCIVNVDVPESTSVTIDTVQEWIQSGGGKVLAEGRFKNGPEGLEIWNQAFSDFSDRDTAFYDTTIDISNTGSRSPYVSACIQKTTVTLRDGTELDNVYYISFNRSSGNPERVMIMQD